MEIIKSKNFDDIRPLYDSEVPSTIKNLVNDPLFRAAVEPIIHPLAWNDFASAMNGCKTVADFQRNIIYPFVRQLIDKTTTKMRGLGWDNLDKIQSHIYISNHRDIVLDAAFLNILFFETNIPTSEIAIGDNLLIYPWINELVRLNKSFIVRRNLSVRETLEASKHLSEYIFDTVSNREQSVWIAQREGRAKDSNDKTQTSLLKMLTLYNNSNPVEALEELNIVPVSITYEYDPCDFLKAKEYQLKRDDPEYKKTQKDDLENMMTGILGFKGNVYFHFGQPINHKLSSVGNEIKRNEILEKASAFIDIEIYKNYVFFPSNYIAYDRMTGTSMFVDKYTEENVKEFDEYLEKQIQKVNIENKDTEFLREKIIEMYGNTVKNFLAVQ